ncbi:LacI family DNA-binding transcriptional regulator [Nesterenkonia haasae]|uniref:LacI family DNA-binding transcriptional regulator n=1 Tax=Nesterenkonia haasae TaxID=2587813 RepID=UPI001390FB2E|nr:LacI family DNA-binding transcriptional regulator [Nesterenkonia haasae]NDK32782.1 LacI family DNA-binding transcriptional regulator [Nesterenkonia haasae]
MSSASKRPTVKDVAAEAGVGVMTVSYTFNKPERVAKRTRDRVRAAAEKLGYHLPDSTARALRSGRTGQLGVVFGEHLSYAFDDPQAALFLAGVADVCVEEDLGMVLIPTRGEVTDVERILGAAVDGYVLWTTTDDDPVLDAVVRSGRPAAIQGGPDIEGITRIGSDDQAAARAVAAAALPRGDFPVILSLPLDRRREPGLTHGSELPQSIPFPVTRHRLAGYRASVTAAGYDWHQTLIAVTERNHREHGAAAVRALLPSIPAEASVVVLAMSDELALGARDALGAQGDYVTVSGWDASPAALAAGIITVTNPLREQGRLCARTALDPSTAQPEIAWNIIEPPQERTRNDYTTPID